MLRDSNAVEFISEAMKRVAHLRPTHGSTMPCYGQFRLEGR
jgi:hypothetical protein